MAVVAEELADALHELGVQYVFGVPSGNWVDYCEALRSKAGIEFILVSNEASAGFMADICWRLTGKLAACFGTHGPGACNLSTGVCCGFLDRSPMLALADESSDKMLHRVTQMNIDQQSLFKPISKLQARLRPDTVKGILYQAAQLALSHRPGPAYIGLPAGLGLEQAASQELQMQAPEALPSAEPAALDSMLRLFEASRRPLMALGIGASRSGSRALILKIAEKFRVPVVLTPMAKGMLPEDHPCYAGVLAHALADQVALTHQQADLVLGVGYDPVEINYEEWIPDVPLVHIDPLPADVDREQIRLGCEVLGSMEQCLQHLDLAQCPGKDWDLQALARRRTEMFRQLEPVQGRFEARGVLSELRRRLPGNGIMTCDVGAHLHLIGQQWKTPEPGLQLMTNGCSSMGFGIPAAIAAKLCCPDREVCCVTGDGGFLMMAGEMATAARLNTKVVFVVMLDRELALISIKQDRKSYRPYATGLHSQGYEPDKSVFGVPVLEAHDQQQYQAALDQAFAESGPVIVQAFVNKDDYQDLILKGNK